MRPLLTLEQIGKMAFRSKWHCPALVISPRQSSRRSSTSSLGLLNNEDSISVSLLPSEVKRDPAAHAALGALRQQQPQQLDAPTLTSLQSFYYPATSHFPTSSNNNIINHKISRFSKLSALALTLVGYKGGISTDQINQDSAFVLKFSTVEQNNRATGILSNNDDPNKTSPLLAPSKSSFITTIAGVIDGHGTTGHGVAEWSRNELLQRLSSQWLGDSQNKTNDTDDVGKDDTDDEESVKKLVKTVLLEMDRDMPEELALPGGATTSFVICRQSTASHAGDTAAEAADDDKLYFVNLGDSQSFLVAAIVPHGNATRTATNNPSLLDVQVVFSTKGHKPDDPKERARLETLGVSVTDADRGVPAQVWFHHNESFSGTRPDAPLSLQALTMSRALGDREAIGVIADPTIVVWKISDAVKHVLDTFHGKGKRKPAYNNDIENTDGSIVLDSYGSNDANSGTGRDELPAGSTSSATTPKLTKENVRLFVVSVTDGITEFLSPEYMARPLAQALYEAQTPTKKSVHALTAAEELIHGSSSCWDEKYKWNYRDDMTITVAEIY